MTIMPIGMALLFLSVAVYTWRKHARILAIGSVIIAIAWLTPLICVGE